MPSFTFTSPEGKKYTVDGPAGSTKEQAFGILQTQIGGPKLGPKDVPDSPAAARGPWEKYQSGPWEKYAAPAGDMSLDQQKALAMASARARASDSPTVNVRMPDGTIIQNVPEGTTRSALEARYSKLPDSATHDSPGIADKVLGGIDAAATLATGATTGLLGRAGATLGGIAGSIATGEYGTQQGAARAAEGAEEGAQKLTYAPPAGPAGEKGREYLESISRLADESKIAGLGPMALPAAQAAPARGAARTALAPEIDAMKRIPGKLADAVTPKPAPEIAALAKKAEALGIELRPDMLANNKFAKLIGEALEQVPLSGSKAEQRQMAFNGALTKIVGGDPRSKRLTPDVFDRAMTESGEMIGQISKETPIRVDDAARKIFSDRTLEASKFETRDVAQVVENFVIELGRASVEDGVIPGETFRKINSKLGQKIRNTSNGDLKHALSALQEDMHDILEKNISSPERLAELKDARYKYAMGKIIEPLVAKAKGGDISPAALMGAVTSDAGKKSMMARGKGGDIGDLARIGQAFLKEPGSSGTAERNLAYGLIGDTAAIARDVAIYPAANLYNRLGPKITKRAVNRRAIDPAENQPWSDPGIINILSE